MIEHTPYRARDQPQNGSASQDRKEIVMHKFEKRDAKSRTLVILAVVGLAAALTLGIFTAVRLIRKPAASKDDPKTSIVYDSSAVEGGWDNLSPEEIAEKLNRKVEEGMINISMNTAPYFENGTADGNLVIVNESINNYPQKVQIIRNDTGEQIYESGASIEAMDDRTLNFYVVPCFNVDEVFGTFVETDENDHALNIYANYDMQRQQVCDELEITRYGSGIEDQSLTYHLNAAEKEVLREKMEAYCMQREHMPLNQLCQEILQEQDAPTQEMQL